MSDKRKELIDMANLYLNALADRDPSRLPVTDGVRFTENTKILSLGQGSGKPLQELSTAISPLIWSGVKSACFVRSMRAANM